MKRKRFFEVLEATKHSWKVYNDTFLMSLARLQFPQLWDPVLQPHFHGMEEFEEDCRDGSLPEYSFVEPSFQLNPNDEHPPHEHEFWEQFLLRVWKTVSGGKDWNSTLLVITFDEHGGCYDTSNLHRRFRRMRRAIRVKMAFTLIGMECGFPLY